MLLKMIMCGLLAIMGTNVYAENVPNIENVHLTTVNTVLLNGTINDKTISSTLMQLMTIKSKRVYLYISSPGGSIFAGNRLIDYLRTTDKEIYCVADYAASMAFSIMQHCTKRFVTNNSVIMQHEASLGIPANSQTRLISITKMMFRVIDRLEHSSAKRMGISMQKYKREIRKDWWMYGADAIQENAADSIASITCSNKMIKDTYDTVISNMFFSFKVTWSKCPLLVYPVAVDGDPLNTNQEYNDLFNSTYKRDTWTPQFIKKINSI